MDLDRPRKGTTAAPESEEASASATHAVALSADDQHFLAQLAFDRPLTVDPEREARLTAEGLVQRRYGQLVLTLAGRELLGLGPELQ